MLAVRIQAIDGTRTFTLLDSQPCRLLLILLAYYDDDGSQALPPLIHVVRFEGQVSLGSVRDTDIRTDPSMGEIWCLGSALSISEEDGLVAIDTHLGPSAECVQLLSSDLYFKAALPGRLLARLGTG